MSPWAGADTSGASYEYNAARDALVSRDTTGGLGMLAVGEQGDPYHPLANPLYTDYHGLPPIYIQVGEAETLLEDSRRIAARAKAAGEKAVRAAFPDAAIVRPSIVFGPEDSFFNRFGAMARFSPVLPLIGGGTMRMQPVYVKDLAEGVARIVERNDTGGRVYEFGGPEKKTFRELMELLLVNIARRRILLPIPVFAAKAMAFFTQFIPNPPLTPDQVRLLGIDNVVSEAAEAEGRTLAGLGIRATAMEIVLPTYLYRFRRGGQFERINAS
jgi:NADH dehydrogenase